MIIHSLTTIMILGSIEVSQKVITGAFTILFTFQRDIDFTMDDIVVETLEGDSLGHSKDSFGGVGNAFFVVCYLPDMRKGISLISVEKEGVQVEPTLVEYDTVTSVNVTWGTPVKNGSRVNLPVFLETPLEILKKRNFSVSPASPFQLYGSGDTYTLSVKSGTTLTVYGKVRKQNGIDAVIERSVFEVE